VAIEVTLAAAMELPLDENLSVVLMEGNVTLEGREVVLGNRTELALTFNWTGSKHQAGEKIREKDNE